jgi:carbon storage regulator CsrA
MLVITLQTGAKVRIGSDIHLVIVAVKGKRVRLGFTAPPAVRVERCEVRERDLPAAPPGGNRGAHPARGGRGRRIDSVNGKGQPAAANPKDHKTLKGSRRK